ncbi:MAG: CsgG/HfaB family protein [Planctomycetota bacterium]|jgi:hypothetical protein
MFGKRTVLLLLVTALTASATPAETGEEEPDKEKAAATKVALAILDYEAVAPGNPKLGMQIAEILTARLSIEESLTLVERAKLKDALEELQLKLAGLVDQDDAAKVGKLTGARLLVMGKAFVMDEKLMIITKLVGVETGRVVGGLRKVDLDEPISDAIMLLAEDIGKLVRNNAEKLLPETVKLIDPVAELRKKLAGKARPAVAVVIPEEHIRRPEPVMDPAVETEIKKLLGLCGIEVVDTGSNELADWAKDMLKAEDKPWPAALNKADYAIVGEAFSEFLLRTGDLVTCAGRAEINVINRRTGKIVMADRHTDRAVDLAETIAGKTALQKAGRKLALAVLEHFAETLPPAEPPKEVEEKEQESD